MNSEFRWQTMDGRVLQLSEMTTKHIFNSMKMCFNHLAAAAGGKPVWFTHQYREYCQAAHHTPEQLAWLVVLFIQEIERRRDLPAKYDGPYNAILAQLRPRLPEPERLKIPSAHIPSAHSAECLHSLHAACRFEDCACPCHDEGRNELENPNFEEERCPTRE